MKRLHWLIIKSFLGPFVLTFFIVMFVLLMQFLWRYIDELVGKGLNFVVISELMLYTSASLVAMALPLSILMASLMTFGNLGEFYELTAIKSSGISLQRILIPLLILVFFISIIAFIFSNNVLPIANLKMRTLLWDIRQQRPEVSIREGEFYSGIDDYSIRVNKKNQQTGILYGLKIYDHTQKRGNTSVIIADSGNIKITVDKKTMVVTLWDGISYNEEAEDRRKRNKTYPHRMDKFKEQIINIELSGFGLQRSDESLFRNNYQMMSLRQLDKEIDSLYTDLGINENQFKNDLVRSNYFLIRDSRRINRDTTDTLKKPPSYYIDLDSLLNTVDIYFKQSIIQEAIDRARSTKVFVESIHGNFKYKKRLLRRHEIEWHKKFTLSIGCLIFLLVGAPLGAIIRKGGLGMPTVISVLLFIFWYVISLIGEKVVRESVIPSYQGIWISSFILLVIGLFLLYKASTDSAIFNVDIYLTFFRKLFGLEKNTLLSHKFHLAGNFDYTEVEHENIVSSLVKVIVLSNQCSERLNRQLKFPEIVKSDFRKDENKELVTFDEVYNKTFETLMTSKWARITYVKNKLSEYPYISVEEPYFKNIRFGKVLTIIVFPIFIYGIFKKFRLKKRLREIEVITQFIISGLENPVLLSELEFQK